MGFLKNLFYPRNNGKITKGDNPAIKNTKTPAKVRRLFESIIPVIISIIAINANIGGIMWENNNELITSGLYAIFIT